MSEPRTHTAAIGLTFDEWNSWRAAAKSSGHEHTSDWVREVVGAAIGGATPPAAADAKRELARELANIGAQLGAITDALNTHDATEAQQAALQGTDTAAAELSRLAGEVVERW